MMDTIKEKNDIESRTSSESPIITVGILTVSDRCFAKLTIDEAGKSLQTELEKGVIKNAKVMWRDVVSDDQSQIQNMIKLVADDLRLNLLLTTGGTGFAPRDVTPESTMLLLDKVTTGLTYLQISEGLKITPLAALSRAVSGIRKFTLIVNLPGSTKGALESLKAVAPVIPHTIDLILDRKAPVKEIHKDSRSEDNFLLRPLQSKVEIPHEGKRLRVSPFPMLTLTEVLTIMKETITALPVETMNLKDAMNHILAEDVVARESLPYRDSSIKDGYAIASETPSKTYRVVGNSRIGFTCDSNISGDEAYQVSTGSTIPCGTVFIVPVEHTAYDNGTLTVKNSYEFSPGVDIRKAGSDLQTGVLALSQNTLLNAAKLSVIAAVGQTSVKVIRKPTVAVLSTGDELQNFDEPTIKEKVRDSNRPLLLALLESFGFQTIDLGIAPDNPNDQFLKIIRGYDCADVVITSGGMSMGQKDLLKSIFVTDLDATIHFGRIKMKPGKPTAFAVLHHKAIKKYWFGLPGNPASTFVTFHVVVLPALKLLMGHRDVKYTVLKAKLIEKDGLKQDPERLDLQRGILSFRDPLNGTILETPVVRSTEREHQHSSRIANCADANCLIEVPQGNGFYENNTLVNTYLLE